MFTETEMKALTLWRDWCVATKSDMSFETWCRLTHAKDTALAIRALAEQRSESWGLVSKDFPQSGFVKGQKVQIIEGSGFLVKTQDGKVAVLSPECIIRHVKG